MMHTVTGKKKYLFVDGKCERQESVYFANFKNIIQQIICVCLRRHVLIQIGVF